MVYERENSKTDLFYLKNYHRFPELFEKDIIDKALSIIVKLEKGYKEDLLKTFEKELGLTKEQSKHLFENLLLLHYVNEGISKNGKLTWTTTYYGYLEGCHFLCLLWKDLKRLLSKLFYL